MCHTIISVGMQRTPWLLIEINFNSGAVDSHFTHLCMTWSSTVPRTDTIQYGGSVGGGSSSHTCHCFLRQLSESNKKAFSSVLRPVSTIAAQNAFWSAKAGEDSTQHSHSKTLINLQQNLGWSVEGGGGILVDRGSGKELFSTVPKNGDE
ncbi:hypothetical protein JZ751_008997, partial [Albula glossodonta]